MFGMVSEQYISIAIFYYITETGGGALNIVMLVKLLTDIKIMKNLTNIGR